MPRPQTYTDSEITQAIKALMAEGGTVNPMRVKRRLGGGNVSRIKALLAKAPRPTTKHSADLPADLMRALERLVRETALQALALSEGYGATGSAARRRKLTTTPTTAQRRIADLESQLASAREQIVQLEMLLAQDRQMIAIRAGEQTSVSEAATQFHAALRNAESDLRAAQRVIDAFERNRQQDREEIRELQRRVEGLVAELAILRPRNQTDSHLTKVPSSRSVREGQGVIDSARQLHQARLKGRLKLSK